MTCRSCTHSRYQHADTLWCALLKGPCVHVCQHFEYEPGTDELES